MGYKVPLSCPKEAPERITIRCATPVTEATFAVFDGEMPSDEATLELARALNKETTIRDRIADTVKASRYGSQKCVDEANVLHAYTEDGESLYARRVKFIPAEHYTPADAAVNGICVGFPHFKTLAAFEAIVQESLPCGSKLVAFNACRSPDDFIASWFRRVGISPFRWCLLDGTVMRDVDEWERASNHRGGKREVRVPAMAFAPWNEQEPEPKEPERDVLFFDFETLGASAKFKGSDLIFLHNARLMRFGGNAAPRLIWNKSRLLVPPADSSDQQRIMPLEPYPLNKDGFWPDKFMPFDEQIERHFDTKDNDLEDEGIFGKHELIIHETSQDIIRGIAEDFRCADVLSGHNIGGFDLPCFVKKAEHLDMKEALQVSKFQKEEFSITEKDSQSKNKGWNKVFMTRGLSGMDIYDTYTLFRLAKPPEVSKFSLEGMIEYVLKDKTAGKDPVPYHRMKDLYQTPRGRHILVRYCAKDTLRCAQCFIRKMWLGDVAAKCALSGIRAETCMNKGSTSKLVSLLSAPCTQLKVPILFKSVPYSFDAPDVAVEDDDDEGEDGENKKTVMKSGGYVAPPMAGVYHEPVGCHDFASLYPYIIIGFNICFRTIGTLAHFKKLGKTVAEYDEVTGDPVSGDVLPIVRYHKRKPNKHHLMPNAPEVEPPIPPGADILNPKQYELVGKSTLEGESAYEIYREVLCDDTPCVMLYKEHDESTHGICPMMAKKTLALRKKYKNQMKRAAKDLKTTTDVDMRMQYQQEHDACDSLQKAAKELCNSLFGVFGCPGGPLYNQAVATSIPKVGCMLNLLYTLETTEKNWRPLIQKKIDENGAPEQLVEDVDDALLDRKGSLLDRFERFEAVYGDTDSIMVLAHGKLSRMEHLLVHTVVCEHLNAHTKFETSWLRPPEALDLELEAFYAPVIFLPKKKSYVYRTLDMDSMQNEPPQTFYKGVTAKKKNTEQISKDLQIELFETLLNQKGKLDKHLLLEKARDIVLDACFRLDRDLVQPSHLFKTTMLNKDPGSLEQYLDLDLNASNETVNGVLQEISAYKQEHPALRIIRRAHQQKRTVDWTSRFNYIIGDAYRSDADKLVSTLAHNEELLEENTKLKPSVYYYVYNVILKQAESILRVAGLTKQDTHALFYSSTPKIVGANKRKKEAGFAILAIEGLLTKVNAGITMLRFTGGDPDANSIKADRALNKLLSVATKEKNGVHVCDFLSEFCAKEKREFVFGGGFAPGSIPTYNKLRESVKVHLQSLKSGQSDEKKPQGRVTYPKKGYERFPAQRGANDPYIAFKDAGQRVIDIEDSHLLNLKETIRRECFKCKQNCASNPLDDDAIKFEVNTCNNRECPTLFDRAWLKIKLKEKNN